MAAPSEIVLDGNVLPLYTFEAFLAPAGEEEGGGRLRALGSPLHYPEAALNCNEAVDMQLDRYAP